MEEGKNGQWTIMKATRDGRFKIIVEDMDSLKWDRWEDGVYHRPGGSGTRTGITVRGLPSGAKPIEVKFPVNYGGFDHIVFLFEHESFDEIKKGEMIPSVQPDIHYQKENQSLEEFLVEHKAWKILRSYPEYREKYMDAK